MELASPLSQVGADAVELGENEINVGGRHRRVVEHHAPEVGKLGSVDKGDQQRAGRHHARLDGARDRADLSVFVAKEFR